MSIFYSFIKYLKNSQIPKYYNFFRFSNKKMNPIKFLQLDKFNINETLNIFIINVIEILFEAKYCDKGLFKELLFE